MPIWFELIFLLLITYFLGIGIGWIFWGRQDTPPTDAQKDEHAS
ncbi:MAG: hypothetical protein WA908_10070 [Pontixanthobacter sp.]